MIFIHLCEAYLGISPHFNLWRALYHLKGYPSNSCRNMVGSAAFSLRQGRLYPPLELRDINKGWNKDGLWCQTQLPVCLLAPAAHQSSVHAGRSCQLTRRWSK